MKNRIIIAIVGHGKAGKTTSSQWLADHTALRYEYSTSQFAKMTIELPGDHKDRAKNRTAWANAINAYNMQDGGIKMYKDMLPTHDIFDGIRRSAELKALGEYIKGLGGKFITIWLNRDVPADPGGHDVCRGDCRFVVNNNGDLRDLFNSLEIFYAVAGVADPVGDE